MGREQQFQVSEGTDRFMDGGPSIQQVWKGVSCTYVDGELSTQGYLNDPSGHSCSGGFRDGPIVGGPGNFALASPIDAGV